MSELKKTTQQEITELKVGRIIDFLDQLGLPSDNIIADESERNIINKNLPEYLVTLPDEIKRDARYISKYVVGAGFGLFDYALNSIWNEVTLALRNKAITYGLDMFYDAAVGGKLREVYKTEDDLAGLKDITLLDASKKLELISDITYKKLAHILDMRNDIGISHPTNYAIKGFELLSYLQTCIQDVIQDKPSEAAIQIKAFIDNLKKNDKVLDNTSLSSILPKIKDLSSYHCSRILLTLFGVYVSDDTAQVLRKNIALIIPTLWTASQDLVKHKLGIMLEGYRNNLHQDKYERGSEFFDTVKGNSFRTTSEKQIAISDLTDEMENATTGWDNYYHEVPVISKLLTYIKSPNDLPKSLANDLINVLLRARIGRGHNYQNGVSPSGKPLYNQFFSIVAAEYFPEIIVELASIKVRTKLRNSIAKSQLVSLLQEMKKSIVNERHIEALDYLISKIPSNGDAMIHKDFQKITSTFLTWS